LPPAAGAGAAGLLCPGSVPAGAWPVPVRSITESPLLRMRPCQMPSEIEVIMKTMAAPAVAFVSKVVAPRGPNAVCEPMPPNAPARSAALPLCSSTTMIRNKQTTT